MTNAKRYLTKSNFITELADYMPTKEETDRAELSLLGTSIEICTQRK